MFSYAAILVFYRAVERHMQTFHHREKKKVIEHFMALVTTRVQSDFI
jgi:hypothetical protein